MALSAYRSVPFGFSSVILFLIIGVLLTFSKKIEADPILIEDNDSSVFKTLKLNGSLQSANAVFVVPDEQFSFAAIPPAFNSFSEVMDYSMTVLSFLDCKMRMIWDQNEFSVIKYDDKSLLRFSHKNKKVKVTLKKHNAFYGGLVINNGCTMNLKLNDNPNIEGKFVVNLTISREDPVKGKICDIELDFGNTYKYYKKYVPTENPEVINSATGNNLLLIIGISVGVFLLVVLLGFAIFCVCKHYRETNQRQIEDQELCTALPETPLPPTAKVLPMTKEVLSTTDVSWTFKTARPKDLSPPPKEMFDTAYAYLESKRKFKETDTSKDKKDKVYALLKKKQAWDYSSPMKSSEAKTGDISKAS